MYRRYSAQARPHPLTWLTYAQLGLYCYYLYAFGPVVALLRDEQGVSNTLAIAAGWGWRAGMDVLIGLIGVTALAVAGLFVAGLGNAMHYPLGISMALAAAPRQPEKAAGVMSYSMGLSFGAGPLLMGLLADEVGAHRAMLLVPVFIMAAALLAWRLGGTAPQRETSVPEPAAQTA